VGPTTALTEGKSKALKCVRLSAETTKAETERRAVIATEARVKETIVLLPTPKEIKEIQNAEAISSLKLRRFCSLKAQVL